MPHKKIDSHRIVIQKGKVWIFIVHLFLSLFSATAFYHFLEIFFTALLCSISLSAFLVKSLYQKLIVKESVVIFFYIWCAIWNSLWKWHSFSQIYSNRQDFKICFEWACDPIYLLLEPGSSGSWERGMYCMADMKLFKQLVNEKSKAWIFFFFLLVAWVQWPQGELLLVFSLFSHVQSS